MRGAGTTMGTVLQPVRLLLAVGALCVGTSGALAQGGLFDFLNNAFGGGGGAPAEAAIPQPDWVQPDAPPLTVRPHQQRKRRLATGGHPGNIRYNVADLKGITIYTDKTLARGDAVMTPTGLKVFVGSSVGTHTDDDFVALAESGKMAKDVRRELVAIDTASRPAFQR